MMDKVEHEEFIKFVMESTEPEAEFRLLRICLAYDEISAEQIIAELEAESTALKEEAAEVEGKRRIVAQVIGILAAAKNRGLIASLLAFLVLDCQPVAGALGYEFFGSANQGKSWVSIGKSATPHLVVEAPRGLTHWRAQALVGGDICGG